MKMTGVSFGVRIPDDLLKKVKYIAEYESRSVSGMIRYCMWTYVEAFEAEHGKIG